MKVNPEDILNKKETEKVKHALALLNLVKHLSKLESEMKDDYKYLLTCTKADSEMTNFDELLHGVKKKYCL